MQLGSEPSVSRRLLIAVAVPLLLFFAFAVVALDFIYRNLTAAFLRQVLEEQVVALVTAVDLDPRGNLVVNILDPDYHLDLPASGQYAMLRDASGRVLWKSPSLAGTGLVLGSRLPVGGVDFRYQRARDGTQVAELSKVLQWGYGSGADKNVMKLVFTVATSTAPQMRQLWAFRRDMVGWFAGLMLALLATMAWMMRRALAPVRRLEREIAGVEGGAAARLGEGYPRELAGVTRGLNALLDSERDRIARYRDTLGNLAHGLKTPLAVIRSSLGAPEQRSEALAAESASAGATAVANAAVTRAAASTSGAAVASRATSSVGAPVASRAASSAAVADFGMAATASTALTAETRATIQLEIDRMAQIVEHQLKRAGGGVTLGQPPVAVLPLVTELRAALLKVHARKDLRIEVDVPSALGFLGDSGDILELLGNVLDNACKWCRSCVAVSAHLDADRSPSTRLSIVVEDDGPGIAPADRKRVIERGVRTHEHVPGYGLGLAIVSEAVSLYAGKLYIDHSVALGGARVELQLPGR